jgi:hypothetical protein
MMRAAEDRPRFDASEGCELVASSAHPCSRTGVFGSDCSSPRNSGLENGALPRQFDSPTLLAQLLASVCRTNEGALQRPAKGDPSKADICSSPHQMRKHAGFGPVCNRVSRVEAVLSSHRLCIVSAPRQNAGRFPRGRSGKHRENAMGMMIVRHKVRDYGQWRPIFDRHADMQVLSIRASTTPLIAIRVRLSSCLIPRIRRRLRTSRHPLTSKKRWRRLEFWTLRQSIFLNRSNKHPLAIGTALPLGDSKG